jgi:hypothetical protein
MPKCRDWVTASFAGEAFIIVCRYERLCFLLGALARRSNLDQLSARRPEIASLSLAMTIEADGAQ